MARLTNGINPDKLNQEILDLGIRCRLWKATICPNMTSLESMDHDINCKVCNKNMIDFCPRETVVMFQQQDLIQQFKVQGTFHMDEIQATFLSSESLHLFAKVELLDFVEDFHELVQRQVGTNIDLLKYAACEVHGLFVVRNSTQQVQFYFGVDFELDANGSIKWLGSNKPTDKEIYTVYYRYRPVFRAIKAIHRDRYSQYNLKSQPLNSPSITVKGNTYVKLPETWILKRDYLLERRDFNQALLTGNTFYDPNS